MSVFAINNEIKAVLTTANPSHKGITSPISSLPATLLSRMTQSATPSKGLYSLGENRALVGELSNPAIQRPDFNVSRLNALHSTSAILQGVALANPVKRAPTISLFKHLRNAPQSPKSQPQEEKTSVGIIKGMTVGMTSTAIAVPFEMKRTQMNFGSPKFEIAEALKVYPAVVKAKMPNRMMGNSLYMGSVPVTSTIVSEVVDSPLVVKVTSAAISGLLPCMVTAPIEKIAEKMEKSGELNFSSTFKSTLKKEGIGSFWRGSGTATTGYVVHKVLFFPGSHLVKAQIEEGANDVTARQSVANAVVAGAVASIPTAPVSHFSYRVAAEQRNQVAGSDNPPQGMFSTAKTIVQSAVKQCGLRGFIPEIFKGLSATMLRTPIVGAVTIATCELVNQVTK